MGGTLRAESVTLAYERVIVIEDLSLAIPSGQITALIGPNGSGKSTLLRALARLLKPRGGSVYLDNASIFKLPTRSVARQLGLLPQGPIAPEGLTVRQLVAQGRSPHQTWLQRWSQEDEQAVTRALSVTRMSEFADRPLDTLSGGQRQCAWLALAIAQDTAFLLLDEPTTFLDLAHQLDVLELLKDVNAMRQQTIVMVLHDLNQAARYAHNLVMLHAGRIVAEGPPSVVFTEALIEEVFGITCHITQDPVIGAPLCIPLGRSAPLSHPA